MKMLRWLLPLAVLLAASPAYAGVDGPADGQSFRGVKEPVYIGGYDSLNAVGRIIQVNERGYPIVVLSTTTPYGSGFVNALPWISNTNLAAGAADSLLAPADVSQFKHLYIYLKVTTLTAANGNLAIEFRSHVNALNDSMSTSPLTPYRDSYEGAAAAVGDTLQQGILVKPKLVTDNVRFGEFTDPSATVAGSSEWVYVVDKDRNGPGSGGSVPLFNYPNPMCIPFERVYGQGAGVGLPNLTVRVRNLNASGGLNVTMWVYGSTL